MLNRRTTLLGLAAACGAGLSRALWARPATADGADAAMRDDLARMGSHEYSDEGIPVLLACIDLVGDQRAQPPLPTPDFSRQFAADLRRYGDAWQQRHPDAPETDISKVIEVLAERDFAGGGRVGAP